MTSQQQSLKKEADVVFQQHNVKKAAELYTNAINVDPSSELAGTLFSNRSLCHHKLGNFQEALKDGITATTLKPNWARGYLRVASAYESLGKEDEAIDAYQKSLDLEENQDARQKYIALFRKNVDNMKKTQEEFKIIGNGYVQKKKYDEAVIIYNASIDLDPSIESAAPIYSNRSLCFFHLGRFQEAEDDACMAIFLKPEFARGYLRRAMAEMKLEKWKESFEAFEKYFELDPENAKSDPDLVKNKNSVRRLYDQKEDENRRHKTMIETKRAELMAIKNQSELTKKACNLMYDQVLYPTTFDVEFAHMLVECGANLAPFLLDRQEPIDPFTRLLDPSSEKMWPKSVLTGLLSIRGELPLNVLPKFDELIFFIIDEMLRRNVPFMGVEFHMVCNRRNTGPINPKFVRVLLETNKFNVNGYVEAERPAPLLSLVLGMIDFHEPPPEDVECLHLLLNCEGIDVNKISELGAGASLVQFQALGAARHPEIAKILIHHGANVNEITRWDGWLNVIDTVLKFPRNPHLDELVRLLIRSGARLLRDGRDGKSSHTIFRLVSGVEEADSETKVFVTEKVFQTILQLNQDQGLGLQWQCPVNPDPDLSFLVIAICEGAPFRFVELLCAMNPASTEEAAMNSNGARVFRGDQIAEAVSVRIGNTTSSFEEAMQILGLLLEHGFDLFEKTREDRTATSFAVLWRASHAANQDVNLLKKTIIDKRGEQEFQRCMKTLK